MKVSRKLGDDFGAVEGGKLALDPTPTLAPAEPLDFALEAITETDQFFKQHHADQGASLQDKQLPLDDCEHTGRPTNGNTPATS